MQPHEVGACDSAVEVGGDGERAGVSLPVEHPLRESADDVPPFRVDVVQNELGDVEP